MFKAAAVHTVKCSGWWASPVLTLHDSVMVTCFSTIKRIEEIEVELYQIL
jgi:hypothetical protein